jgi:alanine racemase
MKAVPTSNQFRPTRAHIDLAALRHNFQLARACAGDAIHMMAVVKANAYGHGAVEAAKVLELEGAGALAVATPEEGIELREAGIRAPILILGGPFHAPGDLLAAHRLTPVLFNLEQIEWLNSTTNGGLEVQLKVDTGMGRLGVLPDQLAETLAAIARAPHLQLKGVMTHLAQADTSFEGPTAAQYQRFEKVEALVKQKAPGVEVFHVANSPAILGKKLGPCTWARPGIMLYGANPNPRFEEGKKLRPVMRFETEVVSLKRLPAGAAISYGGTWVAPRDSRIAALAVGYADGYSRHLSNAGEVMIRGNKVPVVGRVCMDLTMVDVTAQPEVRLGDPVLLWGPGLPVEAAAEKAGTISYELLCAVSRRVPRIYQGELA